MRRLLHIVAVLAGLVAIAAGSGCTPRYDGRLVAADSLMRDNPDSALAIVSDVDRAALATEGDRAYRDLLLTQARYRCYITATSDSDINRALHYYRHHPGEREKLTRALIYKGAVMEELGHPDSAMHYYMDAEEVADQKNYADLAQMYIRMASLYRRYYADETSCFEKYEKALGYYEILDDKEKQGICLYNMASLASVTGLYNYNEYLDRALELAHQTNDSILYYDCLKTKCRILSMHESDYEKARQLANFCLAHFSDYLDYELIQNLSFSYANLHMQDSAKYYMRIAQQHVTDDLRTKMNMYWTLSIIYKNDGDTIKSSYYNDLKNRISESIDNDTTKNQIERIDNKSILDIISEHLKKINSLNTLIYILVIGLLLVLIAFAYFKHKNKKYVRTIINELRCTNITQREELLKDIGAKDEAIENYIHNLVLMMHTSIDSSQNDAPKVFRRRISETVGLIVNDDFWSHLRAFLDKKHNNIISTIAQRPKISEADLRVIELMCCRFSYVEIAVTMGYSINYISTKRKAIAKKLAIKIPLQDYLNKMMADRTDF